MARGKSRDEGTDGEIREKNRGMGERRRRKRKREEKGLVGKIREKLKEVERSIERKDRKERTSNVIITNYWGRVLRQLFRGPA